MKLTSISTVPQKVLARTLAFAALAVVLSGWAYSEQQEPLTAQSAAVRPGGTEGYNTKTMSAIVNVNGTLALGPAGSNSFILGTGIYEVDMPANIPNCVYTATVGDALSDVPAPGIVVVTQRAGNPHGMYIQTFDLNGTRNYHPFHVQVQC